MKIQRQSCLRERERTRATNIASLNTPMDQVCRGGEKKNEQKKKLLFGNRFKTESIRKLDE